MKKFSLLGMLSLFIAGCASVSLEPQANRVFVSPNPPPKECHYLGQIVGNQGNFFTGTYTSNKNLEEGAMNDLKNKAHKLGANYVQIVTSRAGGNYQNQTNVTNVGNAYACPGASLMQ